MANKVLFEAAKNRAPEADANNLAGGKAYKLDARHALAQIAMTGTFNGTFYASPESILELAKKTALQCADDPMYIAQVAIAAREQGYMKDMPAFLVTLLANLDTKLFGKIFNRVIDNGKMLRNVIQMARSGQVGRVRNVSSRAYRNAIQRWFSARSAVSLWRASIGNDPSFSTIMKLTHPKPDCKQKAALYAYLKGTKPSEYTYEYLPPLIRQYEDFKNNHNGVIPDVDWRLLDSLRLGKKEWIEIAKNAKYMMTFRNLNTFARHEVFKDPEATKIVVERLKDATQLRDARIFPYQLMTAWKATSDNQKIPFEVKEALQDAMEIAASNVPSLGYKIYICIDVSGSMRWGITAGRQKAKNYYGGWVADPNVPQCIDVAALFVASIMRANHNCEVIAFSNKLHPMKLNPRDSIMTNSVMLANLPAGGTNCSLPLAYLNEQDKKGDVVVFVSDYESWIDTPQGPAKYSDGTKMHQEWINFKRRNPKSRLICMDLTPRDNGQVKERPDVLQIGGFSDRVFDVIAGFMQERDPYYWVHQIENIEIDTSAKQV